MREFNIEEGEASGFILALRVRIPVVDIPVDRFTNGMTGEESCLFRRDYLSIGTSQNSY